MPSLAGTVALAIFLVSCAGLLCGCQASTQDDTDIALRMYRAHRLSGDPERTREVQRRLGCDPCEEISDFERTGEKVTYLYNSDSAMVLSREDIVSASLVPIARGGRVLKYMLLLTLSDSGRTRIKSYEEKQEDAMTANEIGGRLVGLKPLALAYDQYVAATIENESDAVAAAAALKVPVHRDNPVEDPTHRDERSL